MIKLMVLTAVGFGLSMTGLCRAEPPPRDQRAPFTEGSRNSPPAFLQTDWRPGYAVPEPWRPRYYYYETRYRQIDTPIGPVIETYSDGTASWILRPFKHVFDSEESTCINWMWSADTLPTLTAPETTKAGDDFAIRLYVFGWTVSGKRYGFNYVWTTEQDPGSIWKSPYSSNKLMALQKGANRSGEMIAESRDLDADLKAATGDSPRTVEAIAIMTDTEGSSSVAAARISEVLIGTCQMAVS